MPNFPQTHEDAANVLSLARASRDQQKCRKLDLRLELHQVVVRQKVMNRRGGDEPQGQDNGNLQILYRQLSEVNEKLAEAEQDIGLIRFVIRKRGFPLEFGIEYHGAIGKSIPADVADDDNASELDNASAIPSNFGADSSDD
jgi:hypothetical protein